MAQSREWTQLQMRTPATYPPDLVLVLPSSRKNGEDLTYWGHEMSSKVRAAQSRD